MAVNKKEMVKNLVQAYFNAAIKYWVESDKIPVEAKENITYEEDTEELTDYLLAYVMHVWNTRAFLDENFIEKADCGVIMRFYKGLKDREVDWDNVWNRLIETIEIGEEVFKELEEV